MKYPSELFQSVRNETSLTRGKMAVLLGTSENPFDEVGVGKVKSYCPKAKQTMAKAQNSEKPNERIYGNLEKRGAKHSQ